MAPSEWGNTTAARTVSEGIPQRRATRGVSAARISEAETSPVRAPTTSRLCVSSSAPVTRIHHTCRRFPVRYPSKNALWQHHIQACGAKTVNTAPYHGCTMSSASTTKSHTTTATAVRAHGARSFNLVCTPYCPPPPPRLPTGATKKKHVLKLSCCCIKYKPTRLQSTSPNGQANPQKMQLNMPPRDETRSWVEHQTQTIPFSLPKNYAKYQQGQKLKGARLPALSTASRAAPAAPTDGTRAVAAARVRTVTLSDVGVYPCHRRSRFRFIRLHLVARSRVPVCLGRVGLAPVAVEPSVHGRHLGVGALTRFEPVCCVWHGKKNVMTRGGG